MRAAVMAIQQHKPLLMGVHDTLWWLLCFLGPCSLHAFAIPLLKQRYMTEHQMVPFVDTEEQESPMGSVNGERKRSDTKTLIELKKTIGIDYGLVRTGLAMSGGYAAAQPLQIVEGPNICDDIIHTMRLYELEQIVLGWPVEKNGTVAEQALLTRDFGMELKERVCRELGNIPMFLCDERYTSKAARATLNNNKEGLERVDAFSACMILDSFFGGETVLELGLPEDTLNECLEEYAERRSEAEAKKKAAMEDRDLKRQRRKAAIARDGQLQAESSPTKKKKKKKKRR